MAINDHQVGEQQPNARPRGFRAMDAEKQREIASRGGKSAHAQGRAHVFTPDEARAAGRKGGEAVSRDRAHMAAIGRLGGLKSRPQNGNGASPASSPSSSAPTPPAASTQDGTGGDVA